MVLWLSVVEYTTRSTFAQLASGCELTGQYYTWEYMEWWYVTGQELIWWTLSDCTVVPWYWTGGALDESGVLTWQTRVEESQTDCVLTGQTLSEWYLTWGILTGGYWAGGYLVGCDEVSVDTGIVDTWIVDTWVDQHIDIVSGSSNGICESQDIILNIPISWSVLRDIFSIDWSYVWTDCTSGLSLQLRDHNNQRIDFGAIPSWVTSYTFDSKSLYSFQQSGLYSILGDTGAGDFTLYSWAYSGTYSRFFTWYMLRFLSSNQTTVQETSVFTIDNKIPTLTWVSLLANWVDSWYLNTSGVVTLSFTASEELTWLQATLWSGGIATSSSISWLVYTYVRNLASFTSEGALDLNIAFADIAWNTGTFFSSWLFIFDTIRPTLSSFVFTGDSGGVYLNFSWSERMRYTFDYQTTWWTMFTGAGSEYLTAHHLSFSWITMDELYTFDLNVFDRAGNARMVTGDFLQTNGWAILSHITVVPVSGDVVATWTLSTLALILKAEVEKFNACKDSLSYTLIELDVRNNKFTLQMPMFEKSQMKTLVNAFTLFVLDKVKNNTEMTSGDINEITTKFDSFLIILKLLRDDDNSCKQNLSNYHITQFKNVLEEFHLDVE